MAVMPQKRVVSPAALDAFLTSSTHNAVVDFIEQLNSSVVGVPLTTTDCAISLTVAGAVEILDQVETVALSHPPVQHSNSRFGNPAFRDFYDEVQEKALCWHGRIPGVPETALQELTTYFTESWGSRERIDYGSGMELNFLCWMLCLEKVGIFSSADHRAMVLRLFWRYIRVMRVLQSTYWLEPAGSHGVWGLDDYHFLPFLFGSAQLRGHKYLRPKSIHDADVLEGFSKDFMYLACVQFINSIKTASLRWHSPMLDDISGVKTWEKVNTGMIKMYRAEVLAKLPVIQHFLFGSILPRPEWEGEDVRPESLAHVHASGDCCGIPIPAAFAAAEARERPGVSYSDAIRRVPFDTPIGYDTIDRHVYSSAHS